MFPAGDSSGLGMGRTVARAHVLSGDASFQLAARDVVQIVWALSHSIGENMYLNVPISRGARQLSLGVPTFCGTKWQKN